MERFLVHRNRTVYKIDHADKRAALVSDFSLAVPVSDPCTLQFVDVPVTLPKSHQGDGPATVTVTVTSDTGCENTESVRLATRQPEWVSLSMDFKAPFTVESELTVRIRGSEGGEPCPVCVLASPTLGGTRVHLTVTAAVDKEFTLESTPRIVVAMPVYGVEPRFLEEALESVKAQSYPHWELRAFLDGGEGQDDLWGVLQAHSGEITVVGRAGENMGISRATMRCLEGVEGDDTVVAFLDCDDRLHPDALMHVAKAFSDRPMAWLAYTDEDKIDEAGRRGEPHFKPDFNREMLYSQNYPCHLTAARAWVVRDYPLDPECDGAQDHDFWLRATRQASDRNVIHIPEVLYHWRKTASSTASSHEAKGDAWTAGMRAVWRAIRDDYDDRGAAMKGRFPGTYRCRVEIPASPRGSNWGLRVGIVIPTRNNLRYLDPCLRSIASTSYPIAVTTVIVDNGSDPEVSDRMSALALECERQALGCDIRFRVSRDDRPFNWSAQSNHGYRALMGDDGQWEANVLVFMNDDVEARDPYWLRELVQALSFRDVAAAGPKLLYPDGRIQHAGVVIGMGGIAGHAHKRQGDGHPAYFCRPHIMQRVSAVTGACMAVWRRDFEEAGAFDEALPTAFNDIDFCLRLNRAGRRVVYTPWSVLTHHESVSRGPDTGKPEFEEAVRRMELRWGCSTYGDPYFNRNLDLSSEAFVPRVPWTP